MARRRYITYLITIVATLAACSTTRDVKLESTPTGAEVRSATGELLGKTPLLLVGDTLLKATNGSHRLNVTLHAFKHVPRAVIATLAGQDALNVALTPYDRNFFTERFLTDFAEDANALSRRILDIHSALLLKNVTEARTKLRSFQADYPNIAASFVLAASVDIIEGDFGKARGNLTRALELDKKDPTASRLLKQITGKDDL